LSSAKQWLNEAESSTFSKTMADLANIPRSLAVFGHFSALMTTHAGRNLPVVSAWSKWGKNFVNQFKFFRDPQLHERAMQDIEAHPDYVLEKTAGLRVDPGLPEDWGNYIKFFGKALGEPGEQLASKYGDFFDASSRSMDALKVFRHEYFQKEINRYNGLRDSDPQAFASIAKTLASKINHISGFADIGSGPAAKAVQLASFAPNLEASRWAWLGDHVQAAATLPKAMMGKASPAELAGMRFTMTRAAQFVPMLVGTLAANAALLKASNQDDKINFSDPTQADWLRFKWGGHTADPLGGAMQPIILLSRLFAINAMQDQKRWDKSANTVVQYMTGKLNPALVTPLEMAAGTTAMGRTLPYPFDHNAQGGRQEPLTWKEYASTHGPIAISEAARVVNTMIEDGMSPDEAKTIRAGLTTFGLASLGVKMGDEPKNEWDARKLH
jgi:hypothetical protein